MGDAPGDSGGGAADSLDCISNSLADLVKVQECSMSVWWQLSMEQIGYVLPVSPLEPATQFPS